VRTVIVALLLSLAAVAIQGHLPATELEPLAGLLGRPAALSIGVVVLGAAVMVVFAGPFWARIARWHRTLIAEHPDDEARAPVTPPDVRNLAVRGVCLTLVAEFVALCLPGDAAAQALPGIVVGLVLIRMVASLGVPTEAPARDVSADDIGDSLIRSIARIDARINWSEGSRSDWDLRVRPVLARQFEMATKASQRRLTDPAAFEATGLMLFGPALWQWVDPDNIARNTGKQRGPGRKILEDIVECLEKV
jgi:hypothetical protein